MNDEETVSRIIDETQIDSVWRVKVREINEYVRKPDTPVIEHTSNWQFKLIPHLVLERMRDVWCTALESMRRAGVLVPVLNAIGCGAFRGPFAEVPYLWAMALWEVLTAFENFIAVFVCFPHFPADQYNLRCFQRWFRPNDPRVFLLSNHSAPHVAQCLSVLLGKPDVIGILNPSDTLAVRKGHIGMFWDHNLTKAICYV